VHEQLGAGVQCVELSSGRTFSVSWMTAATVPSASQERRPRPFAILPTASTPSPSKRRRHERTLFAVTPTRWAIIS
jgi:hypothetical protein